MAVPSVVVCAVPTHSPEGSRSKILLLANLWFRNKKHFVFPASSMSFFKNFFQKFLPVKLNSSSQIPANL